MASQPHKNRLAQWLHTRASFDGTSLSAIASEAGFVPASLVAILRGTRTMTEKSIARIAGWSGLPHSVIREWGISPPIPPGKPFALLDPIIFDGPIEVWPFAAPEAGRIYRSLLGPIAVDDINLTTRIVRATITDRHGPRSLVYSLPVEVSP